MSANRASAEATGSLFPRLAALLTEPQPRFHESLALARELEGGR